MSIARKSLKDLLALLLLALCPMQAIAKDEEWVRVDVFDGRASIEVPKSYKRADQNSLDHLKDKLSGRDGFYKEGMREAWMQTFNEPRDSYLLAMAFGSKDSRAHLWVAEVARDTETGDKFGQFCFEDRDQVSRDPGIYFVYQDRSRKMTFCGGAIGAGVFYVCKRFDIRRVCTFGMDYIELMMLEQDRNQNVQQYGNAKAVWEMFRPSANGPVIERVMESFRYK